MIRTMAPSNTEPGETGVDRRTFIRGTAAAAVTVGSVGVSSAFASEWERSVVTTRDHFSTTWYREVERNDDYGPEEYGTEGTIPGIDTDEQPDEVVVFAHGWLNNSPAAEGTFETAAATFRAEEYDAPMIGFSYDADTLITRWWQATEIAELNGPKLAAFVEDLAAAAPETDIRLVGHSLGGRVVLSALKAGGGDAITSVSLLGAAVDAEDVAVDGEYGDAIGSSATTVDNFWYDDDQILHWAYSIAEFDAAVGEEGCDGEQPETYTDTEVEVGSHLEYYEQDGGCIDQVVASFD